MCNLGCCSDRAFLAWRGQRIASNMEVREVLRLMQAESSPTTAASSTGSGIIATASGDIEAASG